MTDIPKPSGKGIPANEKQRQDDAEGHAAQITPDEEAALTGHSLPDGKVDDESEQQPNPTTGVPPL